MANETGDVVLWYNSAASTNELLAGGNGLPTMGPVTRSAMGVGAPFTLVASLSATTHYPTLTLQVTDLEGGALAGNKLVFVFPHDGAFGSVTCTAPVMPAAGAIVPVFQDDAGARFFITDAAGAITARYDLGAAADNFACACFCGYVYGGAAAISVT